MGETDLTYEWEQLQMEDMQEKINGLFPEFGFSLSDMLNRIMTGDIIGALSDGLSSVISGMTAEVGSVRNVLLSLLVLGIISALLCHFTDVFENHHLHDLRHTFITRAQECDIRREIVSLWAGHKADSSITTTVYTHFQERSELQLQEIVKYDYAVYPLPQGANNCAFAEEGAVYEF